ncbi:MULTISPECIES: hypothetical protein [Pontibacter]|uniref:hypothetical protein n=1 Tax=Pontibacter TaxID=323449 RepID=UPI0003F7A85E|nr:hypothetical protein [Pontibacter actiniarum]
MHHHSVELESEEEGAKKEAIIRIKALVQQTAEFINANFPGLLENPDDGQLSL